MSPDAIAYVVGEFPSNTEYFIQEEIRALEKKGFNIVIFASEKRGDRNQSMKPKASVVYPSRLHFTGLLAYWWVIFHAGTLSTAIWKLFSDRCTVSDYLRHIKYLHYGILFGYAIHRSGCRWIHSHFLSLPTSIAQIASQLTTIPYSISAHANDIHAGRGLPSKINQADFIVTCNEYNRDLLLKVSAAKYIASKIHTVYHGIDLSLWPFVDAPPTKKQEPVRLLCVARLIEKKGIRYLVDAVQLLKSNGRKISCTIVGEGGLRGELDAQVARLGLEKEITVAGAASHSHVAKLLRMAHAFVLPCIVANDGDRDGIPNVLVEAMATGIPVVTTPVGAITELVKPAITGIVVPEKDSRSLALAILSLLDDPDAYATIRIQARRYVENNFNISSATEKLATLFKNH